MTSFRRVNACLLVNSYHPEALALLVVHLVVLLQRRKLFRHWSVQPQGASISSSHGQGRAGKSLPVSLKLEDSVSRARIQGSFRFSTKISTVSENETIMSRTNRTAPEKCRRRRARIQHVAWVHAKRSVNFVGFDVKVFRCLGQLVSVC